MAKNKDNASEESQDQAELPDGQPDSGGQQGSGEETGKADSPPSNKGSVRIRNENLKDGKITLGNGKIAEFNSSGIAEVEASQADRLLKIPGFEKA